MCGIGRMDFAVERARVAPTSDGVKGVLAINCRLGKANCRQPPTVGSRPAVSRPKTLRQALFSASVLLIPNLTCDADDHALDQPRHEHTPAVRDKVSRIEPTAEHELTGGRRADRVQPGRVIQLTA